MPMLFATLFSSPSISDGSPPDPSAPSASPALEGETLGDVEAERMVVGLSEGETEAIWEVVTEGDTEVEEDPEMEGVDV